MSSDDLLLLFFLSSLIIFISALGYSIERQKKMNKVFYALVKAQKVVTATDFAVACAEYRFGIFKKGIIIEAAESQMFLSIKCKQLGGREVKQGNTSIYHFELE